MAQNYLFQTRFKRGTPAELIISLAQHHDCSTTTLTNTTLAGLGFDVELISVEQSSGCRKQKIEKKKGLNSSKNVSMIILTHI